MPGGRLPRPVPRRSTHHSLVSRERLPPVWQADNTLSSRQAVHVLLWTLFPPPAHRQLEATPAGHLTRCLRAKSSRGRHRLKLTYLWSQGSAAAVLPQNPRHRPAFRRWRCQAGRQVAPWQQNPPQHPRRRLGKRQNDRMSASGSGLGFVGEEGETLLLRHNGFWPTFRQRDLTECAQMDVYGLTVIYDKQTQCLSFEQITEGDGVAADKPAAEVCRARALTKGAATGETAVLQVTAAGEALHVVHTAGGAQSLQRHLPRHLPLTQAQACAHPNSKPSDSMNLSETNSICTRQC